MVIKQIHKMMVKSGYKNYLIGVLLVFLVSCASKQAVFHNNRGQPIAWESFRGKWVVVNYWAVWCHSCREEIPELDLFYRQHQKTVVILGVNYDLPNVKILNQEMRQLNIQYPVVMEDIAKTFGWGSIEVVPTTFIVNPQGKLVGKLLGPQTAKNLNAAIQKK